MLIDMNDEKKAAFFIFAHQDDEFGIFQKITDEIQAGSIVYCAYLTDGGFGGASSERRNQESLAILSQLGVKEENIFFMGKELSISDGCLPERLRECADWLQNWLSKGTNISAIYVLAWEGGHQDHDALHAITVSIAHKMGILAKVWQFSLYNGYNCIGPLFKVFHPLLQNGAISITRISLRNRFRFVRYCLCYPSQLKTWIGLFPFVMFHYLIHGVQLLQPVSTERVFQCPHEGKPLYEKRGFFSWQKMEKNLMLWRSELH